MINIAIAGDFGYRGRVAEVIDRGEGHLLFSEILPTVESADYSILNLESPVGDPSLFVKKCGPSIYCTPQAINAIKASRFDLVTLANNHFFDCGQEGVNRTIESCKSAQIETVGGGRTKEEASQNKTIKIKDSSVTIINVCETEFSIATDSHGGSKALNPIHQYYEIKQACIESDFVIVIVHGGHEYYQLPSPRMQETYRFFIDAGASAVINHHQHCCSGYEIYNGKPIFYGLGNFCFDSTKNLRNYNWNRGYMVTLSLSKNHIEYQLTKYIQCSEEPGVRLMTQKEETDFDKQINQLNKIIQDPESLASEFSRYASSQSIINIFNPFFNGLSSRFYRKKWAPSFISNKQRMLHLHYIQCEAHRDILLTNLHKHLFIDYEK